MTPDRIEDALAAPGLTLGIVLIAAHAPLGFAGEGVNRDPAQEAHLLSIGTGQFDAFHQLV